MDCPRRTALLARKKAAEPEPATRRAADAEEMELSSLTVVELRERLRQRSLTVSGRKQELIERLEAAEQAEAEAAKAEEAERSADAAQPLAEMKVTDLKQLLRERGLGVSGRKAELVARLEAAQSQEGSVALVPDEPSSQEVDEEQEQEEETLEPGQVTLGTLRVGQKLCGLVRRLSKWGAFLDIGLESTHLARISRLAERFVEDAGEVVHVGQEVDAWVYRIAPDGRVGLSLVKYPASKLKDPVSAFESVRSSEWLTATVRYTSYWTIFLDVQVPKGGGHVQGMLYKSQLANPEKVTKGQEIQVRVLEIISNTGTLRLTARPLKGDPRPA